MALYRTLRLDGEAGYFEVGSLRLASSQARMAELAQQKRFADRCGLAAHLLTPREVEQRFPLMDGQGVEGALFMPTDGSATAPVLAGAMIREATALGVTFEPQTRVTGVDVAAGADCALETERGRIETETLVIAAGIWSPLIGRMAGISIPLVPMEHQYLETEPIAALSGKALPNLRDPDNLVYFRQKGSALIVGGYERNPRPFARPSPGPKTPQCKRLTLPILPPCEQLPSAACRPWLLPAWRHGQWPGIVYARWRVFVGARFCGAGVVDGLRFLRSRRFGWGRRGQISGRMDHLGRAIDRPERDGHRPFCPAATG